LFTYIFIGIIVGGITGITGASGVLVLIPIFTTFFDIPLPVVLGTSLLVDVIASASVSYSYYQAKHIDIRKSLWIITGALLGAQIGSYFVVSISRSFIMIILAICMIVFGFKMFKSGLSKNESSNLTVPDHIANRLKTPLGMGIMGLIIGVITGIFGAGGGLTVFIILYSVLRFDIKKAVGTSSFVMLLTAVSGVVGYTQNGNIDFKLGLIIGLSAAVGGAVTSFFANKVPEKILARLIGIFFVLFALLMVVLKVLPLLFNFSY
jgi:uncharacterized membrane protein YfcA